MSPPSTELQRCLDQIGQVLDLDPGSLDSVSPESVAGYFNESDTHHALDLAGGAIHWALSFDGVFRRDGYRYQARMVGKAIDDLGAERVVELGSGKGFNCLLLARREPSVEFMGVDLSPLHTRQAQAAGQKMSNVRFQVGDFCTLGVADETFDLAFDVDVMEYATDAALALMETYRVLRPGGWYVSFNHFRKKAFEQSGAEVQRACRVAEWAMAYCQFLAIDTWLAVARDIGFQDIDVRDYSQATMPHLQTLQTFARAFLQYPRLARALLRFLSPLTVGSLVAGLLMPYTVRAGAQGYYMIVMGRPGASEA
jgi:SAM-dependent methyltransferase